MVELLRLDVVALQRLLLPLLLQLLAQLLLQGGQGSAGYQVRCECVCV